MHYDPFDDHIQEDPYPTYRWLRAEAPVYRNDRLDFWTLSRFDDVLAAAHDPARFSSVDAVLLGERSEAMPPMMITMDPPHHDELRRIVSRSFTPRAIGQLQARVRSIAAELLDRLGESSSPVEMVEAFTVPLPVMVIADLLGVARGHHRLVRAPLRHRHGPGGSGVDGGVDGGRLRTGGLLRADRRRPA